MRLDLAEEGKKTLALPLLSPLSESTSAQEGSARKKKGRKKKKNYGSIGGGHA